MSSARVDARHCALQYGRVASNKRTYSEREASLILKRAGELAAVDPGSGRELSLTELESAAEEAGINGALVRRAAAELATPATRSTDNAFLGGPTTLVFEACVDGEITTAAHEPLVNYARRHTGSTGSHDVLGGTLTWASGRSERNLTRDLQITVTAQHGVTTIRVEERLGQLAGVMFGGIVGGVGGGGMGLFVGPLIALGAPAYIPLALVGWVGTVYAVVRNRYGAKARQRAEDLKALLRGLVRTVEDAQAVAQ